MWTSSHGSSLDCVCARRGLVVVGGGGVRKRITYKLLRIEKVDFCFVIFTRMLISEASQQPCGVLRKLKNVLFRINNEPS